MRLTLIPMTLVTLVVSGCGEQPQATAPTRRAVQTTMDAKPGALTVVPLVVTVSALMGGGIASDGGGAYTDGSQNVQAVLDQYGTFRFNTKFDPRTAATRWVTYNFSSPVDPLNTYVPTPSNSQNYHFATGPSAFSPFIPLQSLAIGSSECGKMGNSIANSAQTWRVSYHAGYEDVSGSPTAFAVFTRTDANTWTVAASGACSPNSNVAALHSSDGTVLYGYYNLSFLFTLTRK